MAVATMQGAVQNIRSSSGFSILPKDTLTCRPGELKQKPSDNKTLAVPLSHSRPQRYQMQAHGVNSRLCTHANICSLAATVLVLTMDFDQINLNKTITVIIKCYQISCCFLLVQWLICNLQGKVVVFIPLQSTHVDMAVCH